MKKQNIVKSTKNNSVNKKLLISISIATLSIFLLLHGGPTSIDDKFNEFLKRKDILAVLIGTLISNAFATNITVIVENLLIPFLSLIFKIDLTKSIKINGIIFETNKIISAFSTLIVSAITIIILFPKFQ
jgi:hypothetical protein